MPKMKSFWRDGSPTETTALESNLEPHFQAWKADPNPETSSTLLKAVEPTLHEALRTYAGTSAGNPAMLGKAKVMALQAFGTYDPSRAKLRTHLLSQLQGLRRQAAKSEALVKIPEGSALAINHMRRASEEMADELGREPSTAELSQRTGLSLKRIAKLQASSMPAVSEGQVTRIDAGGASVWVPPTRTGPSSQSAERMWLDVVYNESNPIDQIILERSLGLHGKKKLSNLEIAKLAKLSPGAVSQRRVKLQQRVDLAGEMGLIPYN